MSEPTSAAELDGSEQSSEQLRRHVALLQQLGEATNAMSSASTPDEVALVMLTTAPQTKGPAMKSGEGFCPFRSSRPSASA